MNVFDAVNLMDAYGNLIVCAIIAMGFILTFSGVGILMYLGCNDKMSHVGVILCIIAIFVMIGGLPITSFIVNAIPFEETETTKLESEIPIYTMDIDRNELYGIFISNEGHTLNYFTKNSIGKLIHEEIPLSNTEITIVEKPEDMKILKYVTTSKKYYKLIDTMCVSVKDTHYDAYII